MHVQHYLLILTLLVVDLKLAVSWLMALPSSEEALCINQHRNCSVRICTSEF
jgi:hypothetical protein